MHWPVIDCCNELFQISQLFYVSDELSKEEDVLEWLVENKSTGDEEDVIEDVTAKTLNTLIGNMDNLVVLFCNLLHLLPYFFIKSVIFLYTINMLHRRFLMHFSNIIL